MTEILFLLACYIDAEINANVIVSSELIYDGFFSSLVYWLFVLMVYSILAITSLIFVIQNIRLDFPFAIYY